MAPRAGRPAKSLPPTVGYIEDGRDAYVDKRTLRLLRHRAERWWSMRGTPTTVELPGRRYAKTLENFSDHRSEARLTELLREYSEHGCPRPSGYADVFHALYKSPGVMWSVNAFLRPHFRAGWQQAMPGSYPGMHYRYDMNSAYLWAGTFPLPDAMTYRYAREYRSDLPGVWRVQLRHIVPTLPYPFNRNSTVLATSDEIELYSLPVARITGGVTWTGEIDTAPILAAVRAVSTWKQAGRMYWGRWCQSDRVACHSRTGSDALNINAKQWQLPSMACNFVWAHLIVSRVKQFLWSHAKDARHIFVDSIITPHQLPISGALGAFKLEKEYPRGIFVRAPGWYGPLDTHRALEKMAGVPIAARDAFIARHGEQVFRGLFMEGTTPDIAPAHLSA